MDEVQLLTPVAALSRGLQRTVVRDGQIVPAEAEVAVMHRSIEMGGRHYILEGNPLLEMLDEPDLFAVPNSPPSCRGLINLRGSLVPVFDIRRNLGGGGALRWVLVVGRGESAAGLVVDGLPKQVKVTESARLERAKQEDDFVSAAVIKAYQIEGEIHFVISHTSLLERLAQPN
jgi:chemotaxis signal transduction protein